MSRIICTTKSSRFCQGPRSRPMRGSCAMSAIGSIVPSCEEVPKHKRQMTKKLQRPNLNYDLTTGASLRFVLCLLELVTLMDYFSQPYRVRLDWGWRGCREAAERGDAVV